MGFKNKAIAVFTLLALLAPLPLSASKQEQKDSLVRLIKADYMELVQTVRGPCRRAEKATFLHNGTTLICDTALWQVNQNIINATGHVKVVQNETILTSEQMDYYVNDNLVQCRGTLVQLTDKEHNTLRSHYLEYNTEDSVAVFTRGGSMRSKDGQVIESWNGSYDAKVKIFNFRREVEMFTDSVFVKTGDLDYHSQTDIAFFKSPIDFWKDDNMLSSQSGWYDRQAQIFFFSGHVHVTTRDQEGWCDSLYYYRHSGNLRMLGNAQVQDTTRNMAALANNIYYEDSLSRVTLSREAAVAMETTENQKDSLGTLRERKDTVYFGADTLVYYTVKRNEIPEEAFKAAEDRLSTIMSDPVSDYRRQAAASAAAAEAAAAREAEEQNRGGRPKGKSPAGSGQQDKPADDVPAEPEAEAPVDSLSVPRDSLGMDLPPLVEEEQVDSSAVGFLDAVGNVKVYRYDIQLACDSLRYTDLDSIARFYRDPMVWNDGNRQYSADSISALIVGRKVERVNLTSNAFIVTKEQEALFDQIRSTEVMAYFDTTSTLRRFDALGTADAIFYLKEDEEKGYATVNKVNSKMLSALFRDGALDRVFYFDSPKNDVYPLAQFKRSERELKGFRWMPERRPKGKEDITSLSLRPSERSAFDSHPRTVFKQTDIFFPGYMATVYKDLEDAKRRKKTASKPAAEKDKPLETALPPGSTDFDAPVPADSLIPSAPADSLTVPAPADSLMLPSAPDSLSGVTLPLDSLPAAADSTAVADRSAASDSAAVHVPTAQEIKRMEKEQERRRKEAERQARIDARNAHWDELDARDAAKAEAKAAKRLEKQKIRAARRAALEQKRLAREQKRLQRYVERYRKKYRKKREKELLKLHNDGRNSEEIPEVRESEHSEQRRVPDSALDLNSAESAQDVDGGAEGNGGGGEP